MDVLVVVVPAFLASLVEAVEAVTIILAVGVTRQWRSTMYGALAGLLVLAALVVVFGAAIVVFVPLDALRVVVGSLLLIYGLQWTGKAILRAGGAVAKHDETQIYGREIGRLADEPPVAPTGLDGISFAVAFKAVLLEGLEVAFIVITFGASAGQLGPAALGAAAACLLVIAAAVLVRHPLARVPENGLKYVVGMMLITFGTFWAGEGIGIEWPTGDATLVLLLVVYVAAGLISIWLVRGALGLRTAPPARAPLG